MANLDRAILFKQIDRLYRDGTFTAQNDGQLLDRYLTYRDEGTFEAIVNLHGPMVLSLCRRFLRDPRDIEDAFQATFLILARKAGSIRKREVLSSWLHGVAYRVAVRSRSEVLRRRSVETGVPLLDDPADVASRDVDEVGPVLDQELSRLPEKYRAPIVLCYLKEQTHDQAAAELRWPVGTVRSRLARGRELLKERLTRRGCSPATAMLGMGPGLSLRSVTASVPQPMVQATVAAAGRYLWGATAGAGPAAMTILPSLSGSATTLAQGVLTTMAFTQIKLISAGLTAVGVLAGGAGAWALGSAGPNGQADKVPVVLKTVEKTEIKPAAPGFISEKPAQPEVLDGTSTIAPAVEARLTQFERKLDRLLELLQPRMLPPSISGGAPAALPDGPAGRDENPFELDTKPEAGRQLPRETHRPALPTPSSNLPAPEPDLAPGSDKPPIAAPTQALGPGASDVQTRADRPSARRTLDPIERGPSSRFSLREIEAQLQNATLQFERNKALFRSGAMAKEQYDAPLEQIRILLGRLEDWDNEMAEETARLNVETVRREAELKLAEAQRGRTAAIVALNTRLNERKPGMIAAEELAKDESADASSSANVQVKQAEIQEVRLRLGQLLRRRELVKRDLDLIVKSVPELAREHAPSGDAQDVPSRRPR